MIKSKEVYKVAIGKANDWANYNLDNNIRYSSDDYYKKFAEEIIKIVQQEAKKEFLEWLKDEDNNTHSKECICSRCYERRKKIAELEGET